METNRRSPFLETKPAAKGPIAICRNRDINVYIFNMNIYLELTEKFNAGKCRAIVSSGQAVVLHRLGDWIIREDAETMNHILEVLASYGAHYRFGAPMDCRWLKEGWSSHLEFFKDGLRIRTDFVARPPRLSCDELNNLWRTQVTRKTPVVDLRELAELKKTNREKDYPIIGELARRMERPEDRFLYSRSVSDLIELSERFPEMVALLSQKRPLLALLGQGRESIEKALDAERREFMHRNEERLQKYIQAASAWRSRWPFLEAQANSLTLSQFHSVMVAEAEKYLPMEML